MDYTVESFDFAAGAAAGLTAFGTLMAAGFNEDVDTGAGEIVWPVSAAWTPLTTAEALTIAGGANDTAAGTGARTVDVWYLDADYKLQKVSVTMNGATGVAIGTGIRFVYARVTSVGSNGAAVANLVISDTSNTQGIVPAGYNRSFQAIATVPAGHIGLITKMYVEVQRDSPASSAIDFILSKRLEGLSHDIELIPPVSINTLADKKDISFNPYILIDEKQDVTIKTSASSQNNEKQIAWFQMIIKKKDNKLNQKFSLI